MRIITINKANWTGEEITVRIKNDGSFQVYDYDFRLSIDEALGDTFNVWGEDKEFPVCKGYNFEGTWVAISGDYSREDSDAFVAAIQLLCNII